MTIKRVAFRHKINKIHLTVSTSTWASQNFICWLSGLHVFIFVATPQGLVLVRTFCETSAVMLQRQDSKVYVYVKPLSGVV